MSNKKDDSVLIKDNDHYEFSWGENSYALTDLAQGTIKLPGKREIIEYENLNQTDILIFGERMGGAKTFLKRLRENPVWSNHDWVIFHGSNWTKDGWGLSTTLAAKIGAEAHRKTKFSTTGLELIIDLANDKSTANSAPKLKEWARKLTEPFHLIIRDLSALGPKADEVATSLRILREGLPCPNFHVLIINNTELLFLGNPQVSGYLPFCHCYRLPHLNVAEISDIAASSLEGKEVRGKKMHPEAEFEFLRATGGQPKLVQELVWHLKHLDFETPNAIAKVRKKDIQWAFWHLRQSPPMVAEFWCADLKKILTAHPTLIEPLRAYVSGQTLGPLRQPPPSEEVPLAVAGWVSLDHQKRWGIASQFHAHLARPILDAFTGGEGHE